MDTPRPRNMILGFDAGFFGRLKKGDVRAREAWNVIEGGGKGCVSVIALYDLLRKGGPENVAAEFVAALQQALTVAPVDVRAMEEGARIAKAFSLDDIRALEAASLLVAGVTELYTADPRMAKIYDRSLKIIYLE